MQFCLFIYILYIEQTDSSIMLRKYIFFSAFLFALFGNLESIAQNFELFKFSEAKLYKSNSNIIHAIYLDSVISTNDSVKKYYNYKQDADDLADLSNRSNMCFSNNVNSWLGEKVVYLGNSNYLFQNKFNDSIIIKTNLNAQPWKIISYNSNKYLLATINSSLSSDSILYIDLKAFAPPLDTTFKKVDNKRIIISKSNGFLKIFDFRVFPYNYVELNLYESFSKLKWNETIGLPSFYNFKVGDKFQYYGSYVHPSWTNSHFYLGIDVLEKNSDGYKLSVREIYYSAILQGSPIKWFFINPKIFKFPLDTNIVLPNKRINVVISEDSMLNFGKYAVVGYEIDTIFNKIARVHRVFNCYETINKNIQLKRYIQGIGLFNCESNDLYPDKKSFLYDSALIYYKSQNIEWGDSVDFIKIYGSNPVGIQTYISEKNIVVFPNPTSSEINLTSSEWIDRVYILDLNGRVVLEQLEYTNRPINISNLNDGIYILKAETRNGNILHSRFVKSNRN